MNLMAKCLVCNAQNAKQHYGSWCCNGCKGFFWRTISSQRHYICMNRAKGNGASECQMEDGRRNSCRACRLKRCLQVGMDPNLIRDSWGKSTAASSFCSQESMNAKIMENNERQNNAEINGKQQSLSTSTFNAHKIQLVANYLGWIETLAELREFNDQDKNLLILHRVRPMGWLILAYHQFLNPQKCMTDGIDADKLEVLEREILKPLRELEVNKLEFEILRLACFFCIVPQMSLEGKKMAQMIQQKQIRWLSNVALEMPSNLNNSFLLTNRIFRIGRIFQLLAVVEKLAHQYD